MKTTRIFILLAILGLALPTQAQFGRKKKKESTEQSDEKPKKKKKKLGGKLKKLGNKVKSGAQRGIGNAFTKSTADLSPTAMTIMYKQNMYPDDMIGNATKMKWEAGDDIVSVNFTNREGAGLFKIDGDLLLNGESAKHQGVGVYGNAVPKNKKQTVAVNTSSTQTGDINVKPVASIKIVSINGASTGDGITINAREDLILELEHGAGAEGTSVAVSFIGKMPGTTWLYDIAIVGSNNKLVIPKEAFVNPHAGGFKYLKDNYLVVSRNIEEVFDVAGVGAVRTVSSAMDWTPVNLEHDFEKNFLGQTVETASAIDAHVEYQGVQGRLGKPNAFLGQPLQAGKKIAVASFVVRATKLTQKREYDYTYKTTNLEQTALGTAVVTKTHNVEVKKSSAFPKIPEAEWEKLVNGFYKDFEKELLEKWNITLVPIEQTMQTKNYNNLLPIQDKVTEEVMVKGYKGSQLLIPTSFGEFAKSVKVTFPSDLPEVRMMRELDVDGMIGVTIDCEMDFETGALVPRMAIQITGLPHGYQAGPTVFMKGVFSGKGMEFEEAKASSNSTTELLGKVMQQKDLITAFGKSIELMKTEEDKKKYNLLWK